VFSARPERLLLEVLLAWAAKRLTGIDDGKHLQSFRGILEPVEVWSCAKLLEGDCPELHCRLSHPALPCSLNNSTQKLTASLPFCLLPPLTEHYVLPPLHRFSPFPAPPAEVFPTHVRTTFQGVSSASGKVGAIVADVLFSYVSQRVTFFLSAAFGLFGALVTWVFLPGGWVGGWAGRRGRGGVGWVGGWVGGWVAGWLGGFQSHWLY
jgi:hypothetical protein